MAESPVAASINRIDHRVKTRLFEVADVAREEGDDTFESRPIVVYQGPDRLSVNGVDVMPLTEFLDELYAGTVL